MADLRSQTFAYRLTVASVDGSTTSARKPADTRLDGQFTRLRLPPIVETARTTETGTVVPNISPRGLETMTVEGDTPSAYTDLIGMFGRPAQLVITVADRLDAPVATGDNAGAAAFDREVHTIDGRLTTVDRGELSPDGDVLCSVVFTVKGEYEVKSKAAGESADTIIFKTDTSGYLVQTGDTAADDDLYAGLAAALTA